jgi:hypothetical protein
MLPHIILGPLLCNVSATATYQSRMRHVFAGSEKWPYVFAKSPADIKPKPKDSKIRKAILDFKHEGRLTRSEQYCLILYASHRNNMKGNQIKKVIISKY